MIIYITTMYNMLKMKKMNGLKIFALVLLNLSKFETMFGMKENENEDNIYDEYVNKNYYLIDDFGNKITLDNGEDIKFKIYLEEKICEIKCNINKDILKISEDGSNKILVTTMRDENNKEKTYLAPIPYINEELLIWHEEQNNGNLGPWGFTLEEEDRKKYEEKTIECFLVKKIGEDSINDNYILVNAENNKKEEIKGKNIVFKLLTRNKYLELKGNLNQQENWLKNGEEKYIIDESQNPLFFEEVENDLILYVRCLDDNLYLAGLDLEESEKTINFNKNNSIEVHMAKKEEILIVKEEEIPIVKEEEILKVEKKEEDDESSKCCCGIC